MKNIITVFLYTLFITFTVACNNEKPKEEITKSKVGQKTEGNPATSGEVDASKSTEATQENKDNSASNQEGQANPTENQKDNTTPIDTLATNAKGDANHQVSEATGKSKKDLAPIIPEMIKVKGGSFKMGSKDTEARPDEENIHEVKVGDFFIGKFEITVAQFESFVNLTNYKTEAERVGKSYIYTGSWKNMKGITWRHDARGNLRPKTEYDHPVVHVSWNDAKAYCEWLSNQTQKPFRLLTEAEWEFAARGGTQGKNYKYSGGSNIDDFAWYITSSKDKGTYPVGTKKANELGVYDMSGNVYEWCADWYDSEYYLGSPVDNPKGVSSGISRVVRGGSWHDTAEKNRVANRFNGSPTYCGYNIGFRVARSQ
jgi:formylglycine-generating enzyme required for sulfatase activity